MSGEGVVAVVEHHRGPQRMVLAEDRFTVLLEAVTVEQSPPPVFSPMGRTVERRQPSQQEQVGQEVPAVLRQQQALLVPLVLQIEEGQEEAAAGLQTRLTPQELLEELEELEEEAAAEGGVVALRQRVRAQTATVAMVVMVATDRST